VPPDPAANALVDANRQMNNGAMLSTVIVISSRDQALAGQAFDTFSLRLDNSPHGVIHTSVGGFGGTLSRGGRSANDPIFWAHHGNVDRLWNRWLDQPGRQNLTNAAFLNRAFTFVGVDGNDVSIKVADLLDQTTLGYRYDDEPEPIPMPTGLLLASSFRNEDVPTAATRPLGLEAETVAISLARIIHGIQFEWWLMG